MLEIDGSHLEGGGQILRTAVALSAITQTPITVHNIRAGRAEAGLKAQHLTGIKAAAKICEAKVSGAHVGSTKITFEPQKIRGGVYRFDVGTAGSITLVLQTLAPICGFADSAVKMEIQGGTNVAFSPPIEYFQNIMAYWLEKFDLNISSTLVRRGFYPKGGGIVRVSASPIEDESPLNVLERGRLLDIKAFAVATRDLEKAAVVTRMSDGFRKNMPANYKIKSISDYVEAYSTGAASYAHALFENCKLGASALGEKGTPAEKVGELCSKELLKEISSGATVDKHAADQLIPFIGLFGGSFVTSEITMHTKTNIWVTEQFVKRKFKVEGNKITAF